MSSFSFCRRHPAHLAGVRADSSSRLLIRSRHQPGTYIGYSIVGAVLTLLTHRHDAVRVVTRHAPITCVVVTLSVLKLPIFQIFLSRNNYQVYYMSEFPCIFRKFWNAKRSRSVKISKVWIFSLFVLFFLFLLKKKTGKSCSIRTASLSGRSNRRTFRLNYPYL